MATAETLVKAAPAFILLAILVILAVGALHGWVTLVISLLIALPLLVILVHGYSKIRRETQ